MTNLIFFDPRSVRLLLFSKLSIRHFSPLKTKEKLSFSSEVFLAFFLIFFWLESCFDQRQIHCSVQQSTAETGRVGVSWELSKLTLIPQCQSQSEKSKNKVQTEANKRRKFLETFEDQDFWKQSSEIQRNGGFRFTLLVGLLFTEQTRLETFCSQRLRKDKPWYNYKAEPASTHALEGPHYQI